ncbi:MAG: MFS transporter, partial [Alphaproteobacteria bacterium]
IGWRVVLWIVVGVTLVNGAVSTIGAERPRWRRTAAERREAGGALALMRNRRLAAINGSGATYNVAQQSFGTYLPLFLRESVQLSQSLTSIVLGAAQVASVVSRLGLGAIADRWFRTNRTLLLAVMGFTGAAAIAALAFAGPAFGLLAALPFAVLVGASVAAYSGVALTAVVELVAPQQAGAAVGGHLFLAAIGAMAGPPIFGAIVDLTGHYTGGWIMACVALLAAATVFALLGRRRPA